MAALNLHSATPVAVALAALLAGPVVGWAKDIPDRNGQTETAPGQNLPPEAQPKPPTADEIKTGVIRPPDIDPNMSKRVPNVDPKMAHAPKPQAPAAPAKPEQQGQDQGKSTPAAQPR